MKDLYTRIAEKTGVSREDIKTIALTYMYSFVYADDVELEQLITQDFRTQQLINAKKGK